MELIILYIAKAGIYITMFLLIYLLFLQKTTFFKFNRIYLLSGVILSFILPCLIYKYNVYIPLSTSSVSTVNSGTQAISASNIDMWDLLVILYLIGIIIMSCRSLYSILKFSQIINKKDIIQQNRYKIVDDQSVEIPFSVINYIFINSNILTKDEYDLILKHEKAHVDQYHWIDLVLSEIMIVMQWFNPIAWQYIKRQKENHEFLADQFVIDTGISPALYRAILINQQLQGPVFSFSNSFNVTKPLNRLKMITRTKTSPWRKLAVLVVLPLISTFVWASAKPNYVYQIPNDVAATSMMNKSHIWNFDNDSNSNKMKVVSTKGKIVSVSVSNSDNSSSKMQKLEVSANNKNGVIIHSTDKDANPLVYVDGEEKSQEMLKTINPEGIERVEVLKGESAVKLYGEKAKNGVILVTTKQK